MFKQIFLGLQMQKPTGASGPHSSLYHSTVTLPFVAAHSVHHLESVGISWNLMCPYKVTDFSLKVPWTYGLPDTAALLVVHICLYVSLLCSPRGCQCPPSGTTWNFMFLCNVTDIVAMDLLL
jgi:hypothetical protein